ncbi:MAG: hypothetical protein GY821_17140, partial [Gammaproteobacteria bacterium]|nr:hypothetical protein [Gammaproteobacteria bacterium]
PRRANRRRKAKIKIDLQQQEPTHQMTLRQTDNLNFDGNITSISASEVKMPDLTEEVPINTLWACVEGFVEYVPINSLVQVSDWCVLYGTSQRKKEKTDSGTTPMDYTCTSGTSMGESISASGSQGLSSQQSASTTSALDNTRKGGRKLTDEEEAALVSGQEEGVPKETEREQSGSPHEEREKMESDVELEIEDVAIVGSG